MSLKCPVCNFVCVIGERYCNGCGSVERHRALVRLINEQKIDIKDKQILILSEGKRDNGNYYETAYYLAKHSNLTTLDIIPHCTYFGDKQSYDIYESIEKATSIKDNSFDFVIANHVLTAVENDLTALSEISRILKPNGSFIINDGISHTKTEPYIAKKGQYTRRHYNREELIKVLNRFFTNVNLKVADDLIYAKNIKFIICTNKKNNYEYGSTSHYCFSGWWRHIVIVFALSRTGSSSLEIALRKIGYNTLHLDKGRAKSENKMDQYTKVLSNITKNKPFFEGVKENVFILGVTLLNEVNKIYEYYPGVKIIFTDRSNEGWVISMKNHQLVANRPNPKRKKLIDSKNSFINKITTQIAKLTFFDKNNFLKLSVDDINKKNLLCNFLHIKNEKRDFIYPHISTNQKLKLTREQIEF